MRRDGTYGENLEVVAFARAYNVDVAIHQVDMPVWIIKGSESTASEPPRDLKHIVYHSWEQLSSCAFTCLVLKILPLNSSYSSVRNIDSSSSAEKGSPSVVIRPTNLPTNYKPRPSTIDSSATPPSGIERMIMSTTGAEDLSRIRRMLKEARGDPGRVMELLFEELERSGEVDDEERDIAEGRVGCN